MLFWEWFFASALQGHCDMMFLAGVTFEVSHIGTKRPNVPGIDRRVLPMDTMALFV